jgi:hypothetical protein
MLEWFSDGRRMIAIAIVFAVVAGAWLFRYETVNQYLHRNRLTGSVCLHVESCW